MIELPPPRDAGALTPADTHRTEPGTWREIIARFEHELGPLSEPETVAAQPPDVAQPVEPVRPAEPVEAVTPAEPAEAATPDVRDESPDEEIIALGHGDIIDTGDVAPMELSSAGPPLPPDASLTMTPLSVTPGEPPSLDEAVPWEVAAMTTSEYEPPHSIHDREHDSWPVDADAGDALPAWSAELSGQDDDDADEFDDIGELLLDREASIDPWDIEPEPDEPDDVRTDFPLDAFIVPAGVHHAPSGYDADVAQRVAHRLDDLARQLRDGGLGALGSADSVDELSRVLAAIVTGYVARDS